MRQYDVVLLGASGFTGSLVAEYLLKQYPTEEDLKWALAGRNKEKLERVRNDLNAQHIPILIADSLDRESIDQLTKNTKVVCTTVGPYAKFGSELVASCVANQTHYCDLTGEVQWMRRMIDKHHDDAKANKTKIVHTCGFDSVPSDMGVFFLQEEIHKSQGQFASQIKLRLKAAKGGMSGGTYASLNNVLVEAEKDKSIYKVLQDPYGLNPENKRKGPDKPDLTGIKYDRDIDSWIAPFIMATINTKVVRRSNALLNNKYGESFRYDEAMMTGKGIGGRLKGMAILTALGALMAGKPGSLWKKITGKFLPDPGEGPSRSERENGFFKFLIFGKVNDTWLRAKITGDKDPGYGSTSKMLGEAAVCLAKDFDQLPDTYGLLTPSVAMGHHYLNRLQNNAGLNFEMMSQ